MSINVTVKKGYTPPPPPAEPDTVTITMTRKDAEILALLSYGICGPFSNPAAYSHNVSHCIGTLGIHVYATDGSSSKKFYDNTTEEFRDHVRRIGSAVNQAIHLT